MDTFDFEALYATFFPRIVRYLTRLVGPDGAEDLAQEVFIKISRSLGEFRGESSLSTWVYRIATNAALDQLRSSEHRFSVSALSWKRVAVHVDDWRQRRHGKKTRLWDGHAQAIRRHM